MADRQRNIAYACKELEKEGALVFIDMNNTSPTEFCISVGDGLEAWLVKAETASYLAQEVLEFLYMLWNETGQIESKLKDVELEFSERRPHFLERAIGKLISHRLVTLDEGLLKITSGGIEIAEEPLENLEIHMGDKYNFENVSNANIAANSPNAKQQIIISEGEVTPDQVKAAVLNALKELPTLGLSEQVSGKVERALDNAKDSAEDSDLGYALQSIERALKFVADSAENLKRLVYLLGPVGSLVAAGAGLL